MKKKYIKGEMGDTCKQHDELVAVRDITADPQGFILRSPRRDIPPFRPLSSFFLRKQGKKKETIKNKINYSC